MVSDKIFMFYHDVYGSYWSLGWGQFESKGLNLQYLRRRPLDIAVY